MAMMTIHRITGVGLYETPGRSTLCHRSFGWKANWQGFRRGQWCKATPRTRSGADRYRGAQDMSVFGKLALITIRPVVTAGGSVCRQAGNGLDPRASKRGEAQIGVHSPDGGKAEGPCQPRSHRTGNLLPATLTGLANGVGPVHRRQQKARRDFPSPCLASEDVSFEPQSEEAAPAAPDGERKRILYYPTSDGLPDSLASTPNRDSMNMDIASSSCGLRPRTQAP